MRPERTCTAGKNMYGRITYAAGKNMYGRITYATGKNMYGRITYVRPDYICTAEKLM